MPVAAAFREDRKFRKGKAEHDSEAVHARANHLHASRLPWPEMIG